VCIFTEFRLTGRKLSGIENVNIDVQTNDVEVTGSISDVKAISVIKNSGYSVEK